MENKVLEIAENILKKKYKIDCRLLGGISNYTYVIKHCREKLTVRIPGENCELFTNREEEKVGLDIFESLNLTNKTVYFDVNSGIKISKYIEGVSLNETNERHYEEVAQILHKIHDNSIKCDIDYNPFMRLDTYESYLNQDKNYINDEYLDTKNKFLKYKEYLESQKKVFCHNDSQPSNFIYNGKELKIVDFEFIGNNDCLYDIACYGNIDFNDALKLLEVYDDKTNWNDKLKRLNLWRAFQCLQWYLVASFKDLSGMSETLKINFKDVASMFLNLSKKHLSESEKY